MKERIKAILKTNKQPLISLAIYFGFFCLWFAISPKGTNDGVNVAPVDLCHLLTILPFSAFYGYYSYKKTGQIILPQIIYIIFADVFSFVVLVINILMDKIEPFDLNVYALFIPIFWLAISLVFSIIAKLTALIIKCFNQKIKSSRTDPLPTPDQPTE